MAVSILGQPDDIPVFVINLEQDVMRRRQMLRQFESMTGFGVQIVAGVQGSTLATAACRALVRNGAWAAMKGTIGCFLSHVSVWERIAELSVGFALVLEDDVDLVGLERLRAVDIGGGTDLVFVNDRMAPRGKDPASGTELLDLIHSLTMLDAHRSGSGADGYLLTPAGAKKLLSACERDLFYGHVDGRLLRYCVDQRTLDSLEGSWIASVLLNHHNPALPPGIGIVSAKVMASWCVRHAGMPSRREEEDQQITT